MVKQYVGARYVPKFASPVEWASDTSYEALTIVTFNNASYTSKIPVPPTVGNPANNPEYWALTGNYNAQVEEYRQQSYETFKKLNNLEVYNVKDFGAKGDGITNDFNSISNCVQSAPANSIIYFPAGTYLINSPLEINKEINLVGCTTYDNGNSAPTTASEGSVIKFNKGTTGTVIAATARIGISGLTIDGNSCWINENSAPTSPNTYFDKRTLETWTSNVTGIQTSVTGSNIKNVAIIRCSDSAIKPAPYSTIENIYIKCCNNGLYLNNGDNVVSTFRIQSVLTAINILANGNNISNGRIDESEIGVLLKNTNNVINNIIIDQAGKSGIVSSGINSLINNCYISRSGQNLCTFNNIDDVPTEHKNDCAGICVTSGFVAGSGNVVQRMQYDDITTSYYCPIINVLFNSPAYYQAIIESNPIGFSVGSNYVGTFVKLDNSTANIITKCYGSVKFHNFNNITSINNISDITNTSVEPSTVGEIRRINNDIIQYGSISTNDYYVIGHGGDENITITPSSETTNAVTNDHGIITGNRLIGAFKFTATSKSGYTYTIFTTPCKRRIRNNGILYDETSNKVVGCVFASCDEIGGGTCYVKLGYYELTSGHTYVAILS